jgi:diaminopimelate epimerase
MRLPVTKMQGAGNDFVGLDGIRAPLELTPAQYLWAHKRFKTRSPGEASLY